MTININVVNQFLAMLVYYQKNFFGVPNRVPEIRQHAHDLVNHSHKILKRDGWKFVRDAEFEPYHTEYDEADKIVYLSTRLDIRLGSITKLQGKSTKNDPVPSLRKKV